MTERVKTLPELFSEREAIEDEIRSIDNMALVNYELKRLNIAPHPKDYLINLESENTQLKEQLSLLKEENKKVKRLLHDLTPGGSEFYDAPEDCAAWIRKNREEAHYIMANQIKELKQSNSLLKEALQNLIKVSARETANLLAWDGAISLDASIDRAKKALNNIK